jgi:uncharacterized membrane protein
MAELIVIGFDDPQEADRVLSKLNQLQREYLIDLEDSVVAIRQPNGKVNLKQSVNMVGAGAASGGISGVLWGTLVGLLFLNPVAGMAIGGVIGLGTGALSGSLVDYGINDSFIEELSNSLQPNTSALFILVRRAQPEKVLAELSGVHGRIIRTSLSAEQEARLQAALSEAAKDPKPQASTAANDTAS